MYDSKSNSGVCIVDKNFKILYTNQAFSRLYPDAVPGLLCHQCLYGSDTPCDCCPLNGELSAEQLYFHARLQSWLTARFFSLELPELGECYGFSLQPAKSTDAIAKAIEARKSSEDTEHPVLWKSTLNSMPNGYYRCTDDEDLTFSYISKRFCEMVGYTEEDIALQFKNKIAAMIHPDDLPLMRQFIQTVKESNSYQQTVYRLLTRNGYRWVLNASKYICFDSQYYFQSNIADVTKFIQEQLEREQSLQTANWKKDQYKMAIISGASAIYEVNVTRDILETLTLMNGDKQISPSALSDMRPPCSYTQFLQKIMEKLPQAKVFLEQNSLKTFQNYYDQGKLEWQIEYDTLSPDKKFCHMRKNYFLTQDPVTQDLYVLIVSKDLTAEELERRKQKEALSQSLAHAEKTLRIIGGLCKEYESVYYVDVQRDLCTPYVLPERYKRLLFQEIPFFQHAKAYVLSRVITDDQDRLLNIFTSPELGEALKKNQSYETQYHALTDGKIEHYQLRIIQIGQPHEQIWAYRSIESLVQEEFHKRNELRAALEDAQKARSASTAFLLNMSHEIRAPMNAIIGFTDLAEKNVDDRDKVLELLHKMAFSSRHLMSIINDVLEMTKIESGTLELNQQVVSANDYFDQVKDMFIPITEEKGLRFLAHKEYITPYVHIDGIRVTQLISILLGNAVKYTQPGGTIRYTSKEFPCAENGCVEYEVRVSDTGVGISKEIQEQIHEAFTQNAPTPSSIGQGLTIAKNITAMLGGTLSCSSEPGTGTEFIFRFRAKAASDPTEALTIDEDSQHMEADFTGCRVLLAEGSELNCDIATEILLEYGFSVELAENGAVAVEKVEHSLPGHYDLILMGLQMPNTDGYTAARLIRRLPEPGLSSIPIVAIATSPSAEDQRRVMELGMDGYLENPIRVPALISLLTNLLKA